MTIKIPAGYAHAGRLCPVRAVSDSHVTVFVPQKRRVHSARVVSAALVEISKNDLSDWARERLYP
jgi:hypothetical protein